MKKPIILFGVLALTLFAVWISCNGPRNGKQNSLDTSYVLLSQLAFKAYIQDSNANIEDARALYQAAQNEARDLAKHLGISDPNIHAFIRRQESPPLQAASVFPINNTLAFFRTKNVDLCPCPNSTELCPCPGVYAKVILATSSDSTQVEVDKKPLKDTPIEGSSGKNFKAFATDDLPNGKFELTIRGNFFGKGPRNYSLQIEVIDGKLYVDKWR